MALAMALAMAMAMALAMAMAMAMALAMAMAMAMDDFSKTDRSKAEAKACRSMGCAGIVPRPVGSWCSCEKLPQAAGIAGHDLETEGNGNGSRRRNSNH